MSKVYSYGIGEFISSFEVKKQIRVNHFGEFYRINDIDDNNKTYDLFLTIFETESPYGNFKEFIDINKKTLEAKFEHFLKPVKFVTKEDFPKDKQISFIFLFEENVLKTYISDAIALNEKQFLASPQEMKKVKDIAIQAASAVLELHNLNLFHSFISPESIFVFENKYYLALPGTGFLTAELETNNIKSVTMPYYDLNAFPLAPEGIKHHNNLSLLADVWSIGILISLLSAGRLPFHFETEMEYLAKIKSDRLNLNLESIPIYYRKIIASCLSLNHFVTILFITTKKLSAPSPMSRRPMRIIS